MPIVSELTPEERKHYIDALRNRLVLSRPTQEELNEREKLLEIVRKSADILKTNFGLKRVILIGSLAHGAWFTQDSDIDLVVEGLPDGLYMKAWRFLGELIPGRPVDLIAIESAGESIKRAIGRYGIEL
jgi:predicted nucleotidyltransferase